MEDALVAVRCLNRFAPVEEGFWGPWELRLFFFFSFLPFFQINGYFLAIGQSRVILKESWRIPFCIQS